MLNEPSAAALGAIPPFNATSETPAEEVVIHGHFFGGSADWYVAEYDGEDTFFGYVNLGDPMLAEWGNFSLSELRELRIPVDIRMGGETYRSGVGIEWDEHWRPKPFQEIER